MSKQRAMQEAAFSFLFIIVLAELATAVHYSDQIAAGFKSCLVAIGFHL